MLDLKRWKTVTYQLPDEGGELVFDVKRPRAIEAHKFRLASMEMAASGIAAQDTLNRESEGLLLGPPEEEKAKDSEAPADEAKPAKREPTPAEMARLIRVQADAMRTLPVSEEMAELAFREFVRNVRGLAVDGEAITTGAQLYEVADIPLVLFVIGKIAALAKLSDAEGKASASPSTPA